ncbi:hypothetical protein SPRG_09112 [Saprolegnia parasitica CBS 223.65]|uniref:Lipoxygenase domain-containing protein n=1 Tax=Saprolegnia parasitica (strain CBS 223.65) TaxID=695850 RepID=A0A067CEP9_SAPPC|nr:hypothetical protein SPRG_09112 [Saprolegnia parasitica CBS 223.65]KDO25282.1 hypothetical protein SPRG_09112 [Saprolegnia parasitica CBS 223.65]|eukprot:XP_012203941.1 hypothetical protein SPRG_09112 [Saprolegnia parasitica CBS 223.65]
MAMGVPVLEGLVVHTITAMVRVDGVRGQLGSARDAYVSTYPNGAHWQHLDDLAVVNAYVSEVQRVYNARARHTFARATMDFVVANSSSVPKHRLTVALGECLNYNAAVTGALSRGAFRGRHPVGTLVVSPLDFAVVIASLQSYTLDDGVNPLPLDLLTTVGFHYAPGVVHSGNMDDDAWRRLRQPSAKLYNNSIESPLSSDKRLDFLTHSMIQLLYVRFATWVTQSAAEPITIPVDDEDVSIPKVLLDGAKPFQDTVPFVDNFDDSCEDMKGSVLSEVGRMWPRVRVHGDDRYLDRALELFVFNGLGQHMVTKLPAAHNDGSYYTVTTSFLETVTGADAYFDKKGKVIKIVRLGKTFWPADVQWEYVKMCFRSSVANKVTAVDHLIGLHVTTASREQLPPTHPLRRLIKPFTFRAEAINYEASKLLFAPKGILHRAHPYSENA